MSIPINFKWYDKDGHLVSVRRGFTMSYGSDITNLHDIASNLSTCDLEEQQKFIHPDIRYVVVHSVPDYMFDLLDLKLILPYK
jgi:hypothetical protein